MRECNQGKGWSWERVGVGFSAGYMDGCVGRHPCAVIISHWGQARINFLSDQIVKLMGIMSQGKNNKAVPNANIPLPSSIITDNEGYV